MFMVMVCSLRYIIPIWPLKEAIEGVSLVEHVMYVVRGRAVGRALNHSWPLALIANVDQLRICFLDLRLVGHLLNLHIDLRLGIP